MNKVLLGGSYKKIAFKEGSSLMFKVGIRRDYKNKETGKHDYDNVTVYIPKFNEHTIEFANKYIKDGDFVEVEGHIQSYKTEKDGQTTYHEDISCDNIRIVSSKNSGSVAENAGTAETVDETGFTEIEDEDCPF